MDNKSNRLLSLDILRGLTVACMILVNNGAGHEHFYPLVHTAWNGLTPCDLVFPFFLFMVGVSITFSLGKADVTPKGPIVRKIIFRTIKMFLIGVLLHAWDMWIWGSDDIIGNLRIMGVLERIALSYCAASFIVLYVNRKWFWHIIITLLIIYSVILLVGNGYAQDGTNLACIIDRALFGEAHLYQKNAIDPEGLLGTIPSIAHTLIGAVVGFVIKSKEELSKRLVRLFCIACTMGLLGYLLSYVLPLNKRIWSPTYVLVTCGMATALLALFTVLIDMKGKTRWCRPLRWFGMNAIVLYVASEMLAPVSWYFGIPNLIYEPLLSLTDCPQMASLSYALSFVMAMSVLAWILYKRKIFIKL